MREHREPRSRPCGEPQQRNRRPCRARRWPRPAATPASHRKCFARFDRWGGGNAGWRGRYSLLGGHGASEHSDALDGAGRWCRARLYRASKCCDGPSLRDGSRTADGGLGSTRLFETRRARRGWRRSSRATRGAGCCRSRARRCALHLCLASDPKLLSVAPRRPWPRPERRPHAQCDRTKLQIPDAARICRFLSRRLGATGTRSPG